MLKIANLLMISVALLIKVDTFAQEGNYKEYLQNAYKLFDNGKYIDAQKSLNVYRKMTGDDTELDFAKKIELCMENSNKAQQAEKNGDYQNALEYYLLLQQFNSRDPQVAACISFCRTQIEASVQPVKRKFQPDSYFNMRLLSDFSNKGAIGIGFHVNRSFFQIGFDFVMAKRFSYKKQIEGEWKEDEKNNPIWNYYYIKENLAEIKKHYYVLDQTEEQITRGEQDYVRPKFQFVASPGVNFKYISIECGLGVMISEKILVKNHIEYYHDYDIGVDEWPKSQTDFMIRPSLTGYMPMGKNENGGMSLSLGYNIVNKQDIFNGFIFGVGFSAKL